MTLNSSHFLKWIPATDIVPQHISYLGSGQCLLYACQGKKIEGFTLFREDQLDESFIGRISKRFSNSPLQLRVVLPPNSEKNWLRLKATSAQPPVEISVSSYFRIREHGGELEIRDSLNIVNVDDSPVILKMLKQVLSSTSGVRILDQISDPMLAAKRIQTLQPDAITMDIQMPGKNGIQLVQELQSVYPVPTIMVSSLGLEEGSMVYQALEAGAFDYVQKPELAQVAGFKQELLQKIELAVTGFETQRRLHQKPVHVSKPVQNMGPLNRDLIWCIGSSTGGTQALTRVMTRLPAEIPPTLIVQHIPPVFSKSFADSLNAACPFTVVEAVDGQEIRPNTVYIAPGGFQMGVQGKSGNLLIQISDAPPVNRFKPSVDYLFQSVAALKGVSVTAGILTGMGKDGAEGLLRLKEKGALTFAQDEASSVVYGMPRAAKENGAAQNILALDQMPEFLMETSGRHRKVS